MTHSDCPLCLAAETKIYAELPPRRYHLCANCELVFLDPEHLPSLEMERAEYELHENDPADPRYRDWLSRLTDPLVDGLPARALGLDFGSGPGPAISTILGERGFSVTNYDPFFAPDPSVFTLTYDFIACTETAEHFHRPAREFSLLARMLRPGGRLGVMTRMLVPEITFETWTYRLQPSHVVFYSPETMAWIAQRHHWSLELQLPDVVVFQADATIRHHK